MAAGSFPRLEFPRIAVALDGAGWHPAAWREAGVRPGELFAADYWAALVTEAERGLLDFVTFEDSLGVSRYDGGGDRTGQPSGLRTDHVRGRLDAVLLASRIAPLTSRIGLVPTATTTHTEPFHVSTAIATLDYVSSGRAGWRARTSPSRAEAAHFGRREFPQVRPDLRDDPEVAQHLSDLFDEAADAVEVVRRLWDSWEDDAVIRDIATGRFVDRDQLHYIDFEGRWFSVRGASITPRPPQGQPVVMALAHRRLPFGFAARAADVVFVTPRDAEQLPSLLGQLSDAQAAAGRGGDAPREAEQLPGVHGQPSDAQVRAAHGAAPLRVFADLVVFLDEEPGAAAARRARLDDLDGTRFTSDAAIFTGTPERLARVLLDWHAAGIDGFRLRPGVLPHDLHGIIRGLVPALQAIDAFRRGYETTTLRGHLGLPLPANRYAAAAAAAAAALRS
jgi:alkanesulfonate monooxygenase SsuD/methylene tetrahydromethanopterin reductase-like flavin-dependent oxidoreductase (luciferase family)